MTTLSKREKIVDLVRQGMEQIPGYERQQGWATSVGNQIFDEVVSKEASDAHHCCECFKLEMAWNKPRDLADIAVNIIENDGNLATLRDLAKEYLESLFRVSSMLPAPKF